jgi:hypothetical protein
MTEMRFNEDDKKQVIDFLNMVAKNAKFSFDTTEIIQYFRLLQHMQGKILPKIEANILEVKRVVNPAPEAEIQPETKKGKK